MKFLNRLVHQSRVPSQQMLYTGILFFLFYDNFKCHVLVLAYLLNSKQFYVTLRYQFIKKLFHKHCSFVSRKKNLRITYLICAQYSDAK
jgi:hypothetical protein